MTKILFNNKEYDYAALVNGSSKGISLYLAVTDEIIEHTLKHVSYIGEVPEDETTIIAYMYGGTPVILTALEEYKAYKFSDVMVRMLNKHSIAAFESKS